MSPKSVRPSSKFGRWRYDYATQAWDFSAEVLILADVGSSDPADIGPLFAAMPEDDREVLRTLLEETIAARGSMAGQFRLRTRTRGDAVFALVADTFLDDSGAPLELRGFSTDVTEEVRVATRAAVDAATRHRRAIEQVKGALMVTYRIDEVTAFALLRQQSNVYNVKLNVLSEHVSRAMAAGLDAARVPMIELIETTARTLAEAAAEPTSAPAAEAPDVSDPPA